MAEKNWESYEEVAAYLLNQFADKFSLGRFEGKQIVPGASGTDWEIDAKGCSSDGKTFVVVECKRHTKNGISQALAASLAWVIQDTGASSGILVSPIGLQAGAEKVAESANIHEVILNKDASTTDYVLKFLNETCIGFSEQSHIDVTEVVSIKLIDEYGNVIDSRTV